LFENPRPLPVQGQGITSSSNTPATTSRGPRIWFIRLWRNMETVGTEMRLFTAMNATMK
jgi:hypothetical protein